MFFKHYLLVCCWLTVKGCVVCLTTIHPVNPWYWSDSYIKLTCKTTLNATTGVCSWYVNEIQLGSINNKEQNGQDFTRCSITLLAATAVSGEWRCRTYPASTAKLDNSSQLSPTTKVTILGLSQRECIVIVCSLAIVLAMTLIIALLIIKHRKILSEQRNYFAPSAPANSDEDSFSGIGTPPPSYDMVISDGILANELEFSRFQNNETESQRQQGDVESSFPKTRSAPNLI